MKKLIVIVALFLTGCYGVIEAPEVGTLIGACTPNGGLAYIRVGSYTDSMHIAKCKNGISIEVESHTNPERPAAK